MEITLLKYIISIVLLVIVVHFGTNWIINNANDTSYTPPARKAEQKKLPKPKIESSSTLACIYAEDFVKQKLKSPGSAEFPGTFEMVEHITELGNHRYKIVSWVDSQNNFGALIRTRWSCTIRFTEESAVCEELEFFQ